MVEEFLRYWPLIAIGLAVVFVVRARANGDNDG